MKKILIILSLIFISGCYTTAYMRPVDTPGRYYKNIKPKGGYVERVIYNYQQPSRCYYMEREPKKKTYHDNKSISSNRRLSDSLWNIDFAYWQYSRYLRYYQNHYYKYKHIFGDN